MGGGEGGGGMFDVSTCSSFWADKWLKFSSRYYWIRAGVQISEE